MPVTLDELRRRALNMKDALDACDGLDESARKQMISACGSNDDRILFALKVAQDWLMPNDLSNGIAGLISNAGRQGSIGDFGEARSFIMRKRAENLRDSRAARAKNECWNRWFYPEYKGISNVRDRLVTVATDHGWLNFSDLMEIDLYSLNGFFDWKQAESSAHTFTTCGLFIRACRAAARILEKKDWPTNTPAGTEACIAGPNPGDAELRQLESIYRAASQRRQDCLARWAALKTTVHGG